MKIQIIPYICVLSVMVLTPIFTNAQFDKYFTTKQLRIDYCISGNSDTSIYAFEKFVCEPMWGGSKTNLIDTFGYGDYCFRVFLAGTNTELYSRGYNNLFGEWQTISEAKKIMKVFTESVIMPFPKQEVDVVFYERNYHGIMIEKLRITVNPDDYFIAKADKLPYPTRKVYGNAPSDKAVDIVILPEGYTKSEMKKFEKDCEFFVKSLFNFEPYSLHKDKFNIWAVMAASEESGITNPANGTYKNTVLHCSFYTFNSERYCMSYDNRSIRQLAGLVPYDQIYILANTKNYGGGGIYNFYNVSVAGHFVSSAVIIHEFGHSFAGLADEYYDDTTTYGEFYNLNIEPWEPNITTLKNFDKKWKNMLDSSVPIPTPATPEYKDIIGVYEGAGYEPKGMYRPKIDCLMHTFRGNKFCKVCENAIEKMILFYSE